jgi:hypothetical protein
MSTYVEIRRFYGMDYGGGYDIWRKTAALAAPFNFDEVDSLWPKGHCVAVRITSEDPDDGFKPTGGKVKVRFQDDRCSIYSSKFQTNLCWEIWIHTIKRSPLWIHTITISLTCGST